MLACDTEIRRQAQAGRHDGVRRSRRRRRRPSMPPLAARHSRQGAHLLGPEGPGQEEEARRHRHRSDHAGRRLRLGEPRHARRALEGGLVPLPDARLPRARSSRRDVPHRRRSLRHRLVARDEPGRPQGVAEEVGLEMVVVCGSNMGDIFRRNALNLGLHVVQSPEAVADARDGDEFTFEPHIAPPDERDPGQDLRAGAAHAEGRRDPPDRAASSRPAAASSAVARRPRRASSGPIPTRRARMTSTEQIVWAHRVDKDRPRSTRARRCACTPICCRRRTARRRSRFTRSTRSPAATRSSRARRRSPTITSSSPARTTTTSRRRSAASSRALHGHREAVLRDARRRHLSLLLSRAGAGDAGPVHPRRRLAQPRVRRLRRGRHRRRIDDARLRLVDRLHLLHARAARGAWCSTARLQPWVSGKDIVLELLRRWGAQQSQGMSVELVDANRQLPIAYRNTIANMMAEAEALNGIFAPDDITLRVVPREGDRRAAVSAVRAGRRRRLRDRRDDRPAGVHADDREAVQPGQRVPGRRGGARAAHVRQGDDRLVHQRQLRRSAGRGARRPRGARARRSPGRDRVRHFPGLGRRRPADRAARSAPRRRIDRRRLPIGRRPDPRSRGAGRASGRARTRSRKGERAITSFNRNWQNRMGLGGEGYLASPASSPPRRWSATWRRPTSSG